jgi:hypothetical protein
MPPKVKIDPEDVWGYFGEWKGPKSDGFFYPLDKYNRDIYGTTKLIGLPVELQELIQAHDFGERRKEIIKVLETIKFSPMVRLSNIGKVSNSGILYWI